MHPAKIEKGLAIAPMLGRDSIVISGFFGIFVGATAVINVVANLSKSDWDYEKWLTLSRASKLFWSAARSRYIKDRG